MFYSNVFTEVAIDIALNTYCLIKIQLGLDQDSRKAREPLAK